MRWLDIRPTALDRAIAWLSPRRGVERMRARAALAAASSYVGARRDRNALSEWSTLAASPDHDTLDGLDLLRARSRDLLRNDPIAGSAVSTKVVNVIGTGHVVRPDLNEARLGMTPQQAQDWEERAMEIWSDWAGSPDADVTRCQTFAEMEDLVYRSRLTSGDAFAIRRFKARRGRLLGTCLQIVEADLVSNPARAADREDLAGGIEMDADGAPLACHVADHHDLDRSMFGAIVTWKRIPYFDAAGRRQVMHIHGPRLRPALSRYVPLLAPVIESLKQRSRYSEAELMAAVVSACFAIGLKSDDGSLGDNLPAATQSGTGPSAYIRLTEPGKIFDLLPGEQVQSFAPGRPNPQFAPFIDAIAREIGAGTDLPHELLLKNFQASYSASRAAMEMAWQFFRSDRALHVTQFCAPVYEMVISEAVARGLLPAPGFFKDPLLRAAWLGATWMGPARPTIDPVKDATADQMYLEMGATSLTRITAERFGDDHRSVRRRRALDGSEDVGRAAAVSETSDPANDDSDEEEV